MATTARPITELALGVRDTTGAVVPSGKARFYLPGTLTPTTIYSDDVCTAAITQPLTLNAGGQYISAYALEATRMIVKDSTETTTYYDGLVNVNRHDAVYVTHTSWNGGAETTLESLLGLMATNLGAEGKYLESAGATAIGYSTFLGQLLVSVTNFGAVGDGTTDDTAAVQAASDRVEARGGGIVFFPKGTYRINSAITIDTAGVSWVGAGRGVAIIKNFGTTTNALTVNVSGDCKITLRDFSITANTTSSGAGISFTAGNVPKIENVGVALHRTGIATASVTGARLHSIVIDSTDDNASAVGVSLGIRGRLQAGEITSGTDNGTGVVASGADSRLVDTYVTNFATGVTASGVDAQVTGGYIIGSTTGVTLSGTDSKARNVEVESCTTGISMTGIRVGAMGCSSRTNTTGYSLASTNAYAIGCSAAGDTTGFSVGAVPGARVVGCVSTSGTTDLSVNASATLLVEHSNRFTNVSDSSGAGHSWLADRPKVLKVTKVTTAGLTPSFTPTPQTCDIYVCDASAATTSITIAATSTTGLVDGQAFGVLIMRSGGSNNLVPTLNGQYNNSVSWFAASMDTGSAVYLPLVWRASTSKWAILHSTQITPINGAASGTW
jgi:hypothetical protein